MIGLPASRDGAPSALAWLCHPVTLLSLVLLLVNDHLLKPAFPGLLTGKLSDVAGLLLAPPLVAVLLTLLVPRLPAPAAAPAGLVLVGVGFAVVKSSGYAAEVASSAWSALAGPSLVRVDGTDLLTLPALALTWWTWTRARQRPVRHRMARLVRVLVVLPPALVAVAATSAVYYPYAVGTALLDGQPAVSVGQGYGRSNWPAGPADGRWAVSEDGATTWRRATEAEQARLSDPRLAQERACVPAQPQRCYRVSAGHLRVDQSDDAGASWRVAWELSDARREELARRSPNPGDIRRHFSSRDLIVYPAAGGGHEVLVANGRDGFLRRLPDGAWRREGFPVRRSDAVSEWEDPSSLDAGGAADHQPDLLLAVMLALTLGFLVAVVAAQVAIVRSGNSRWEGIVGGVPTLLAGLLLALLWRRDDDFLLLPSMLFAVLPLGGLPPLVLLIRARLAGAPAGWLGWVLGDVLLTALLTGLPLIGWMYGVPPQSRVALALALVATLPGLLLAVRAGGLVRDQSRSIRRSDPPYPLTPA
ncbi:hypothetical protein [Micromonospora sp. 067-2]|uniref:hypothetical protein n=1 Tax=Micromonospora sp. 067-2 TaxID=2789270 RepID=UPI00397C5616